MKYIATKYFNSFIAGEEVKNPHNAWIDSGLVAAVENPSEFSEKVNDFVESLDPEKKAQKKKNVSNS
jgi:hypothetical protein